MATSTVFLSALDQFMPRMNTCAFLVFDTPDPARAVDSLQIGLQRVNQQLPYLKGRVFATPVNAKDRGRLAIKWSPADNDVELVEACSDDTVLRGMPLKKLKDEGAPLHYFSDSLNPLPPFTDLKPGLDAPVFAANYTLLDGGVVVGFAVQHGVMDASGMSSLIRFWADCTRSHDETLWGAAPDADEPLYRDSLLRLATQVPGEKQNQPPAFRELLARHPEYTLRSDLRAAGGGPPTWPSPPGSCKLFTFDVSKLEADKAALRAGGVDEVTTNSVLCAIIWSCVTRVRAARRNGGLGAPSSRLGFPVNGRTRVPPGGSLSERPFLGNVSLNALAEATVSDLVAVGLVPFQATSLAPAVRAINNAVKRITPDNIASVMDLVDQVPDTEDISVGCKIIHGPDVSITSWANLSLFYSDFGEMVGSPQFLRLSDIKLDGLAMILPRKRMLASGGAEGIEVVLAMYLEDTAALERDSIWTNYLV